MKAHILILVASILLIPALAVAHGGEEHIIGTVTALGPNSITVKTTANKTVTVDVGRTPNFSRTRLSPS